MPVERVSAPATICSGPYRTATFLDALLAKTDHKNDFSSALRF
jgi:hypothetical protein